LGSRYDAGNALPSQILMNNVDQLISGQGLGSFLA